MTTKNRRPTDMSALTFRTINNELENARRRFKNDAPGSMLAAFMKEIGEMCQALLHHTNGTIDKTTGKRTSAINVYTECVQVCAMAIRLLEEGDSAFAYRKRGAESDPENFGAPLFGEKHGVYDKPPSDLSEPQAGELPHG